MASQRQIDKLRMLVGSALVGCVISGAFFGKDAEIYGAIGGAFIYLMVKYG